MNKEVWGLFIGFTKVQFPDIIDVVLKKHNKENNYTQNRLRHKATGKLSDVLIRSPRSLFVVVAV